MKRAVNYGVDSESSREVCICIFMYVGVYVGACDDKETNRTRNREQGTTFVLAENRRKKGDRKRRAKKKKLIRKRSPSNKSVSLPIFRDILF